jgi:AbrB family looped-hinge helix DNA binding protein
MTTTSTLSRNGQTTVPKEVREHLGLQPNQKLLYRMEAGRVYVEAVPSSSEALHGCLKVSRERQPKRTLEASRKAYARKKYAGR